MPLCSELMSRPKKAVAGYRPERTTPGGPSRAGRGRQYCKLRWLLSPKPEFSKCIFELKMPRPVIWQRFTSTNSCHEPPLHRRHLVSACFALGSCAGCSNMPVRSLTRTRRRRRATGRVTKRGIRQERRPSLARRVGIAHSPAATARRREDRAPFASLSDWFEKQHRKARGCSQQTT